MSATIYKSCTTCTVSKSIDDFHRNKKGKYGRNSICKACVLNKYRKNANADADAHAVQTYTPMMQRQCLECERELGIEEYYSNPTARDGFMKMCRECFIRRDQTASLSILQYAELVLQQFRRKYSKKNIQITVQEIAFLWNRQRGLCAITNHPMILEKDESGKMDNIWNMTLFFKNPEQMHIKMDDILLVCHLIRTLEHKYHFDLDKMRDIYQELHQ